VPHWQSKIELKIRKLIFRISLNPKVKFKFKAEGGTAKFAKKKF
jgi:hypothetical protein